MSIYARDLVEKTWRVWRERLVTHITRDFDEKLRSHFILLALAAFLIFRGWSASSRRWYTPSQVESYLPLCSPETQTILRHHP
jgi:hypothetical protein